MHVKMWGNILLAVGAILLLALGILYSLLQGDYGSYLTVINGPFPFDHLGSVLWQMTAYGGLLFASMLCFLTAFIIRRKK